MSRFNIQNVGLLAGPIAGALCALTVGPPDQPAVAAMAGIAALMSVWWITEALPLGATSLVPLVLLPLAGILAPARVAAAYANPIIFLYLGGFLIALAMERWNLHRRLALSVLSRIGRRADFMVLGFLLVSASLSMWISNTATAVMMLPIGLAVVAQLESTFGRDRARAPAIALLLAIAYGASIGGVSTLVGTPTNLAFAQIYRRLFPDAADVTFAQWIILALPIAVVLLAVAWVNLTRVAIRVDVSLVPDRGIVRQQLRALGPARREERLILAVFAVTALLWVFRADLDIGSFHLTGWSSLWAPLGRVDDGTVAIAMALLLFAIPAGSGSDSRRLLDTSALSDIPWPIILLFGGGFALADGFIESGLSIYLANLLTSASDVPLWVTVAIICVGVTFLTELTSNVATVSMLLPLLGPLAVARGIEPLALMVPATISASMAFMMPVGTPPNAIVFGGSRVRISDMARVGLGLNLAGAVVVVTLCQWLLPRILH
jgi:solute carrier family 13 (sodium-dependent dicarboxylate transporter), member 2/3/5